MTLKEVDQDIILGLQTDFYICNIFLISVMSAYCAISFLMTGTKSVYASLKIIYQDKNRTNHIDL